MRRSSERTVQADGSGVIWAERLRAALRPIGCSIVLAVGLIVATPGLALADPPGATDYETTIASIAPDVADVVEFSVLGSDAFIGVIVQRGHTLTVLGYQGEPYVRVDQNGDVFENERSESTYYNESRYGGAIPESADSTAAPRWIQVASGGFYAWHDHRAHWMSRQRLIGLKPGDSLPPETLAFIVDDEPVTVTVSTTLLAPPPAWPVWVGLGIGLVVAAGVVVRRSLAAPAGLTLAISATLVGGGEFMSVPATTGPLWSWWAMPAISASACAGALLIRRRAIAGGLVLVGAVELALWAWQRLAVLSSAFTPTVLPMWFDRMVTASALPIATGLGVATLGSAFLTRRHPVAARSELGPRPTP